MDQVHKRMTTEQVKVLLKGYCQGLLDRSADAERGVLEARMWWENRMV
jgi:hypothetical protein